MTEPTPVPTPPPAPAAPAAVDPAPTTPAGPPAATEPPTVPGEEALGDAGKKALDEMKAKWKAAEAASKERDTKLAELQAKIDGKEAEHAAEQAKRATEQAALAKANDRIRKSEVKAAAKGVLADPQDAYKFLDLDSFDVDDDGNVDEAAITAALNKLITEKPYLAAQGKRFQGSADGGARNDATPKAAQLAEADMARMTPEQIAKAHDDGQFDDLIAGQ